MAELLVALLLTGLLLPFFCSCFFTAAEQYRQRSARLELEENLSLAASCLTEEIAKSAAVLACDGDRLTLWRDAAIYYTLEEDPQQAEHFYRLEGKNLYRREDMQEHTEPVANFIESLTVTYLDAAGAPVRDPRAARAVAFVLAGRWQDVRLERRAMVRLAGTAYL